MSKIWDTLQKIERSSGRSTFDARDTVYEGPENSDDGLMPAEPIEPRLTDKDMTEEDKAEYRYLDHRSLPIVQAKSVERIVGHTDPSSYGANRFRLLRVYLGNLWRDGTLRTLLVTSPVPQDGKTTVSLNLATTLSEHGAKKVLLVDADLHRRSVGEHLGLDAHIGLTECLLDGLDPRSAIQRVEPLGWYYLAAGKRELSNPTDLLRAPEISQLLRRLSSDFDWVLIDSPPVLPLTDALILAQAVDGVLLVARAGQTPSKAIEDTIGLVGQKRILGMVLNGVEETDHPYSKYDNYYRPPKSD